MMRSSLLLPLAFAMLGAPVLHAQTLPEPIRQLQDKGAVIKGRFDAPAGLRGYAAEYQGNGIALYLTADGQHALVGSLFDAKGQDLSAEPLQRLVHGPLDEAALASLEKSAWIADGQADAPRIVYVFSDPNCPYCNMFWHQARPWVESGKVQLRHVMVGIIRQDSLGKSAALLAAKDPVKALAEHEQAGKGSTLEPLASVAQAIQEKLENNLALMQSLGVSATPAIFYRDDQGRLQRQQGAPSTQALTAILGRR